MRIQNLAENRVSGILKDTYNRWQAHNAPRLGAALAYYALLSMAPLAVVIVGICGLALRQDSAKAAVLMQVQIFMGSAAASAVALLLNTPQHPGTGILATAIAVLALFFGGSGVFTELRNALNIIWDAPPPANNGWLQMVKDRLLAFAMVATLGLFLLLSLLLSAALALLEKFASELLPVPTALAGEAINLALLLAGLTILFTAIYKVVPNVHVNWREAALGAAATAILFILGKFILALYMTKAAVGSAYGAAGSLVALVVWVYYSAQIFFFGAEFTHVYALHCRSVGAVRPPIHSQTGRPQTASRALKSPR